MWVTLVGGKIIYGAGQSELISHLKNAESNVKAGKGSDSTKTAFSVPSTIGKTRMQDVFDRITAGDTSDCVELAPQQFLRFKMAGRQHEQAAPKTYNDVAVDPLTGAKTPTAITIRRIAREAPSDPLGKWDVARYGNLTGRAGPWGSGARTNRDHLLAHSSNLIRWNSGKDDYGVSSESELKREGLAVVVSGAHHRLGSATYGGRAQHVNKAHATAPQAGVKDEIDSMLGWKAGKPVKLAGSMHQKGGKATLRIEMVGAYVFLYKRLVEQKIIEGAQDMDLMLLDYLRAAVAADKGIWRIDPAVIGLKATADNTGGSGTTRWKVP